MAETKQPTVDELEKKEEELFRTGPLSVLTTSVKSNSQVLINCRWACVKLLIRYCRSSTLPPLPCRVSYSVSRVINNRPMCLGDHIVGPLGFAGSAGAVPMIPGGHAPLD